MSFACLVWTGFRHNVMDAFAEPKVFRARFLGVWQPMRAVVMVSSASG